MRAHGVMGLKKLSENLFSALEKEKGIWKPFSYNSITNTDEEIGPEQRNSAVKWIFSLNDKFRLNPETLVLAVTIVDDFLRVVKARPKYMMCIAVSCLFLATKLMEEEEIIPSTQYLVEESDSCCSAMDVLRMEKVILNKLHWNLNRVTSIDFLHILHAFLLNCHPNLLEKFKHMTIGRQLTMLTQKLLLCEANCESLNFQPSLRALALISLELGLFTTDWLTITIMLQQLVEVDKSELIRCREVMSRILSNSIGSTFTSLFTSSELVYGKYMYPPNSSKRKVEQIEDDDDIYEGIKRLYGDDAYDAKLSCGSQACSQQDEICIPTVRAL